jgi:elongation factor 1-alpha
MNKINYIPPENNKGCCEYKLKLIFGNDVPEEVREKKLVKIASQMKYRLFQGNGKAIYILGVSDKGDVEGIEEYELDDSIRFIEEACQIINAIIYKKRIYKGNNGFIATLRIELLNKEDLEHDFI